MLPLGHISRFPACSTRIRPAAGRAGHGRLGGGDAPSACVASLASSAVLPVRPRTTVAESVDRTLVGTRFPTPATRVPLAGHAIYPRWSCPLGGGAAKPHNALRAIDTIGAAASLADLRSTPSAAAAWSLHRSRRRQSAVTKARILRLAPRRPWRTPGPPRRDRDWRSLTEWAEGTDLAGLTALADVHTVSRFSSEVARAKVAHQRGGVERPRRRWRRPGRRVLDLL